MNASHLLLGRTWQFDHEAMHDWHANTYSIFKGWKRVLLKPLSPSTDMQDQLLVSKVKKENLFPNKGEDISMDFVLGLPRTQQGKKQVKIVLSDLMWIHHYKKRFHTQRKSMLMSCADGPFWVLEKDGVGADYIIDLRANPFQQGGYDVPHHGRFDPINLRKEDPELESPMVSYNGPNTRSRAKFVPFVTHLDDKEAFESLEGNWSQFRSNTSELKISATRVCSNSIPRRWLTGAATLRRWLMTPIFLF